MLRWLDTLHLILIHSVFTMLPLLFYPLITVFPLPLVLFGIDPIPGELFELPKMFGVYCFVILLLMTYLVHSYVHRNIVVPSKPLLLGLGILALSLIISTIFSIDQFSSVFGYPTRLHGGLLSMIAYFVLFFILYSIRSVQHLQRLGHHIYVISLIVAMYGVLQYLGFDWTNWTMDAQARVFSSLGQPNWLAAYLCGVFFLGIWLFSKKSSVLARWALVLGNGLLLCVIVLSGSRSGILGVAVGLLIVIVAVLWYLNNRKAISRWWYLLGLLPVLLLFLFRDAMGADETIRIRASVWEGALRVFTHYPLVGSGLETFAYSFYQYRPVSLLQTTEWAFLYNKAHNEILHILSTQGLLGVIAYGYIIYVLIKQLIPEMRKQDDLFALIQRVSLVAGLAALLTTNFFGFSTVTVALLTVLFLRLLWKDTQTISVPHHSATTTFLVISGVVLLLTAWGLERAMVADHFYARSRIAQTQGELGMSMQYLEKAVAQMPFHPFYVNDLGHVQAFSARTLHQAKQEEELMGQLVTSAHAHLAQSVALSPRNVLLWRKAAAGYHDLSTIDQPTYVPLLLEAADTVQTMAPQDVKLQYGLIEYYRSANEPQKAQILQDKILTLKPDFVQENK